MRTAILVAGTLLAGLVMGFFVGLTVGGGQQQAAKAPKTVTVTEPEYVTVTETPTGASPTATATATATAAGNFDASITQEDIQCQVREPCEFGSYTSGEILGVLTVTGAQRKDFIATSFGENFEGNFVVIRFDYTYKGSVPASTNDPTFALEDSSGGLYSFAFDPTSSLGIDTGADLFPYGEIQPGTTQDGVVVFEVGPQAKGFNLYAWDPIKIQASEIAKIELPI